MELPLVVNLSDFDATWLRLNEDNGIEYAQSDSLLLKFEDVNMRGISQYDTLQISVNEKYHELVNKINELFGRPIEPHIKSFTDKTGKVTEYINVKVPRFCDDYLATFIVNGRPVQNPPKTASFSGDVVVRLKRLHEMFGKVYLTSEVIQVKINKSTVYKYVL